MSNHIILQIHMQPINLLANTVAKTAVVSADLQGMQVEMVVASAAALLALLVTTGLAVYKPRGMTAYGWRKQQKHPMVAQL